MKAVLDNYEFYLTNFNVFYYRQFKSLIRIYCQILGPISDLRTPGSGSQKETLTFLFLSCACSAGSLVGLPRHLMAKTKEELDLPTIRIKPYWNRFFSGYLIPTEGVDPQQLGKEKL